MSYSRYNRQWDRDSDWYPRSERDLYGRRRGRAETWDRDRDDAGLDHGRDDWFRGYGYGDSYNYLGDRAGGSMIPGGAWGQDESRGRRGPGGRSWWEAPGYGRSGSGRDYHGDRYGYDDRRDGRGWWDRTSDEVSSWFGDEFAARRREEDRRRDEQEEHHRGKGPRGYTRSDDRIREDVSDRLADNPILDASEIDVSVSSGEVTLGGSVDSRYAKRLAEDLADDVLGVKNVQNNLRVRETRFRRESMSGTYSGAGPQGQAGEVERTMPASASTSTPATTSKAH